MGARVVPLASDRSRPALGGVAALGRQLSGFVGLVTLVLVWEGVSRLLQVPPYILPAPSRIAVALWNTRAILLADVVQTLLEAVGGFVLGVGTAFLTAAAFQRSRTLELTVLPVTAVLQSVPVVALTPIIGLVVGRNGMTSIVIAAIICYFPVLINSVRGLRSTSAESLELLHVLAATPNQVFWLLRLPSALPFLFVALRMAATACVLGAMVAEWLTSDRGLGFFIEDNAVRVNYDNVWAGIVLTTALAIAAFSIVATVEARVLTAFHSPLADVTIER